MYLKSYPNLDRGLTVLAGERMTLMVQGLQAGVFRNFVTFDSNRTFQ